MPSLTVVTRGSLLARTQTGHVVAELQALHPDLSVTVRELTTQGDRRLDVPLPEIGGKGLFTSELEQALLSGEADVAVHSHKDLPTELPDGLVIGTVPARAEARDALVLPQNGAPEAVAGGVLPLLAAGARVGTSSLRRAAFLRHRRPDLQIEGVRGNLDTRLRKLDEGQYEALVLAAAGLFRLDWAARISQLLPLELSVPAPAQGALAIECRAGDQRVLDLLAAIDHATTRQAVAAERAFLAALGGGCAVPCGAHAEPQSTGLLLHAAIARADGTELMYRTAVAPADEAVSLGDGLAQAMLRDGADRLLELG